MPKGDGHSFPRRSIAEALLTPDIRRERVKELRQQIAAGDYRPLASGIAEAIISREQ